MIIGDGSPASDALVSLHAIGSHCTECGITIDEVTGWEQCEDCGEFICGDCDWCGCHNDSCLDDEDEDDDEDKLRLVIYGIATRIGVMQNMAKIESIASVELFGFLKAELLARGLTDEAREVYRIETVKTAV